MHSALVTIVDSLPVGGPGGSGIGLVSALGAVFSEQLGGTYDIVSWDPRGVGQYTMYVPGLTLTPRTRFDDSTSVTSPGEVTCFDTAEEQDAFFRNTIMQSINETIAGKFNEEDLKEFYSRTEDTEQKIIKFGEKCQEGPVGQHLQYIGTSSTVRDLVSLNDRLAGKGKPVDFWGLSYGTVIGYNLINCESPYSVSVPLT